MSLKQKRRMVGLSQHELARLTAIPFSRICWAETGRRKLTSAEVQRIKEALARRAEEIAEVVA
jgi:predicted transcriptional regulator